MGNNSWFGGIGWQTADYIRYYRYYYGIQENDVNAWAEYSIPGVKYPATWVAGQKITSLVNYMRGVFAEMLEDIHINAKSTNIEKIKATQMLFDKLHIQYENQALFDNIAEITGIPFEPVSGMRPQSYKEIEDFRKYDYADAGESAMTALAKHIIYSNDPVDTLTKIWFDCLVAGVSVLYTPMFNGNMILQPVSPPFAIIDRSVNSDYGKKQGFGGYVRYMYKHDILTNFDLDEEQKKSLDDMVGGFADLAMLNIPKPDMVWMFGKGMDTMIGVATLQWIDTERNLHLYSKDDNGNDYLEVNPPEMTDSMKARRKNARTEYKDQQTKCGAVLIGGSIMTDWGICGNQYRDDVNPADTQLDFRVFTPDMLFGFNRSIVSRLAQHQDKIDLYEYKKMQLLEQDKGKFPIFDSAQLTTNEGGQVAASFLDNLYGNRVGYVNTAQLENPRAGVTSAFGILDLTANAGQLAQYSALVAEEEAKMEQIVSIPAIAQGMQQSTVGMRVQQNTAVYSSRGTLQLYKGFVNYLNQTLQYTTNIYKNFLVKDGDYSGVVALNNWEKGFLVLSKDELFQHYNIYINMFDKYDEATKARIDAVALGMAQGGQLTLAQYTKIISFDNKRDEEKYLQAMDAKKEFEAAQAAQQQAAQQQAALAAQQNIAAQSANAKVASTQIQEANKNQREQEITNRVLDKEHMANHHEAGMQAVDLANQQEESV